jgi:hypothetical protein
MLGGMKTRHAARVGLCVLILSGCERTGRSAQPTTSDSARAADSLAAANSYSGPKACDLVSRDDVSHVTATLYNAGVTTTDYRGDSQCKFAPVDTSRATVMITLHAHGNFEPYRKVPGIVQVGGLGDEAVWNSQANQLGVRLGETIFSVSILTGQPRKEWAKRLARIAYRKLNR